MKLTLVTLSLVMVKAVVFAQTPVNPVIKDYGTIKYLDNVVLPSKDLDYKIIVDLKTSNDEFEKVNIGLINIARMLNLHGAAGITGDQIKVAVAIHYTATPIVLNNSGYQKKYGVDNPNLDIISKLNESGVEFYVCGQSLVARKYEFDDVNNDVRKGLSMLTVVTEHMMKGYEMFVFE